MVGGGRTTGSAVGRGREGGGLHGGNQQGKRETDAGAVRQSRKKVGLERK